MSQTQVDDSVIRAVASPRQQTMNQGQVYTDYGGQIDKTLPNIVTRGASDLGLTVGSLGFFPAMDVVRQALPMVLSFLKMAMVICIPLVLVIGSAVNAAFALLPFATPYPLRLLVTITIEVVLMTWWLMPLVTRRLAPWIYPARHTAP